MKNWSDYWQTVEKNRILSLGKLRIRKNWHNLGLWCVKDSQNRITLNLWTIRVQF